MDHTYYLHFHPKKLKYFKSSTPKMNPICECLGFTSFALSNIHASVFYIGTFSWPIPLVMSLGPLLKTHIHLKAFSFFHPNKDILLSFHWKLVAYPCWYCDIKPNPSNAFFSLKKVGVKDYEMVELGQEVHGNKSITSFEP